MNINEFKPIVYRMYLTALVLLSLGFVGATLLGVREFWMANERQERLQIVVEKYSIFTDPENFKGISEKDRNYDLHSLFRCLKRIASEGGWLYQCDSFDIESFFPNTDITSSSRIGGQISKNFKPAFLLLSLLVGILALRYWIHWMITGKMDRTFP